MADAQLFLVRVWQHLSQFRASVRSVDQEEPRLFTQPEEVGEFLRGAARTPATAAMRRSDDGRPPSRAENSDGA